MFSQFTLTPTPTTENTVENETVKIADKQAPFLSAPKAKTTNHAWKFLRLKFSQLFFSCYVRILEQGSKIHGEKSQSQLCWSISDFLRDLLVSFDFWFLWRFIEGHFSFWPRSVQRLDNAIHRINRYPADKRWQNKPRYPPDSDLSGG